MPLIEANGLTMLGIAVSNLTDGRAIQLTLPFDRENPSALDTVVDDVRDRYGPNAITRATLLGRDLGLSVPLLPD
jgi:DNA polymerase-4